MLRAKTGVRRVFTLGRPGHCDKGRVQNLVATACGCPHTILLRLHLRVFVALHTSTALSPTCTNLHLLAAGRGSRSTQVPPIASAPPHGFFSGCWHPVEWANTLLGDGHTSSHVLRIAPWVAALLRRTAVLALQLQNHKGESLSH